MRTDEPLVYEIKNFAFTYPVSNRRIEIKGDITIFRGERALIKGPSGCGKSTLMLAMGGLLPNEIYGKLEGSILFHNRPITHYSNTALAKRIGIVFQNPSAQNITRSVEDELVFLLENLNYGKREIDERLRETVGTFGLQSLLKKRGSELSGGELQKVVLASVLIGKPEVLLLDEPTSYLDLKTEYAFYTYLDLLEKETTVIAIDHKLQHNRQVLKRIVELGKCGEIVYEGSIEQWKEEEPARHRILSKSIGLRPYLKNAASKNESYTKGSYANGSYTVEVKNLSFAYTKGVDILRNVNLTLRSRRIVSVFGLNGSGKTTLLKLILKLLKSHNAKILVKDGDKKDQEKVTKRRYYRDMGAVFQNPESHFLFPTVEADLLNGYTNKQSMDSMLDLFKLGETRLQNPFTLSEGEKRRLNLVQAFSGHKRIILLDEPTFGQDEENILLLKEMVLALKKKGVGFLVISHDLRFMADISDTIYRLKEGRLREIKDMRKAQEEIFDEVS